MLTLLIFLIGVLIVNEQKNVGASKIEFYERTINSNFKEFDKQANHINLFEENKVNELKKYYNKYKIGINFTYTPKNETNDFEFYFGFNDLKQTVFGQNYFKLKADDTFFQLTHYGNNELLLLHNPELLKNKNNFYAEYDINQNTSEIKITIKTNTQTKTVTGYLENMPQLEKSWLSLIEPKKQNKNIKINSFQIEYY